MPEASTGGEVGRANTRPTGVRPGHVRIDVGPLGEVAFTDEHNNIMTDRIREMRLERDWVVYACDGALSFTVPRTWRSGEEVALNEMTWTAIRATEAQVARGRYTAVAGFAAANGPPVTGGGGGGGGTARITYDIAPPPPRITSNGCNCEMCQRDRVDRGGWRYVGGMAGGGGRVYFHPRPPEPSEAERRREAERARRAREEFEQQERERRAREAEVEARAEATLRTVLTAGELALYDKTKEVIVTGADGNRYQIYLGGIVSNVVLLDHLGAPVAALCCHPNMWPGRDGTMLPYRDAHIAQVLYLRHDLDNFWATANTSWHQPDVRTKYVFMNAAGKWQPIRKGKGSWRRR